MKDNTSPEDLGRHSNTSHPCKLDHLEALQAAERLVGCGLRVIPIIPGEKRPPLRDWPTLATTDLEMVRRWWSGQYEGYGVGLVTGAQPDGRHIFAIDLDRHDPAKDGVRLFSNLSELAGDVPDTVQADTGRNGRHLLFTAPDGAVTNSTAKIGPGIDVRGQGGFIVVAPTVHPETLRPYAWQEGHAPWERPIAEAPEWLVRSATQRPEPPARKNVTPIEAARSADRRTSTPARGEQTPADWLRDNWDWEAELKADGWTMRTADDNGDTQWTRPGKDLKEGSSATLHGLDGPLVVWSGTMLDQYGNLGVPAGESGRTFSPFDYFAAHRHGGDTSAAAREVNSLRGGLSGIVTPSPATAPPAEKRGEHLESDSQDETLQADPVEEYAGKIRANLRRGEEVLNKPPVTWLVDEWIPHDTFGVIYGKPGCGKSFYALSLALEVARGGEWVGTKFDEPATVLYIAAERGRVLGERQRAWRQHNGCEIPDTFWELELAPQIAASTHLTAVLDLIEEIRPTMVIIDTLAQTTEGVNENDGTEWGLVGQHVQQMVAATNGGTVIAVHHSGKNAAAGPRGHSKLEAKIDYIIEVTRANAGDTTAGAQMKVKIEKLNHGPHPAAEYYALEPVDLPPADGDLFDTSSAVLVGTTFRAVAGDREARILDLLGTKYLHDGAAKKELDKEFAPLSPATIARALKKLEEAGQIEPKGQTTQRRWHLSSALKLGLAGSQRVLDEPF